MAQIFHPSMNTLAKASIFGAIFIVALIGWVVWQINRSPYVTQVGAVRDQPVAFSHEHHVSGLGIDCRYCHSSVEKSAFAGIPATRVCMTCHSQVWTDAAMLKPVRDSWSTDAPLRWTRVHDLPDYVYFNHSIHVAKGVGCSTCHGQVDQMPLTYKAASLQMDWCLSCHREPEKFVRPKDQVFNMKYLPPGNQVELGKKLVADYHIRTDQLTNCAICHR
jgi:hypothetical protein